MLLAVLGALLASAPAGATVAAARSASQRPDYVPGEAVVRTAGGETRLVHLKDGETMQAGLARLRRQQGVSEATPNYVAHISAFVPDDPGRAGTPGGWQALQWNFMPGVGVNAPGAWENLIQAGRPGGRGVVVAVLDTGVAYRNYGRYRRSPDLAPSRFVHGFDYVSGDPVPVDENGHGTHVASTIAETANNGIGVTGLAYGATIMPVRVLDRFGEGDSYTISRGIRFAARRGADIINLSFEFSESVTARQIRDIIDALSYARRRGVLVVGASGNAAASAVAYPARSAQVLSVAATTEHGCQAEYSNAGPGLDLAAPGGGEDAAVAPAECANTDQPGRDIYQMTYTNSIRSFGLPSGYMGTSMAAPHVSAVAALVIASGVLGRDPSPQAVENRLKQTAHDLGPPGIDARYGAGLVDATAATAFT